MLGDSKLLQSFKCRELYLCCEGPEWPPSRRRAAAPGDLSGAVVASTGRDGCLRIGFLTLHVDDCFFCPRFYIVLVVLKP